MKLELKHLAPYLPYGLQISTDDVGEDWIETVIGLNNEAIETSVGNYWDHTVKPILRPLSDLTNEIEYSGEMFVPFDRYSDIFGSNDDILFENMNNENNEMHYSVCKELPHYVFNWLVSLHFDVFGLIDAGLAIDINTLKN